MTDYNSMTDGLVRIVKEAAMQRAPHRAFRHECLRAIGGPVLTPHPTTPSEIMTAKQSAARRRELALHYAVRILESDRAADRPNELIPAARLIERYLAGDADGAGDSGSARGPSGPPLGTAGACAEQGIDYAEALAQRREERAAWSGDASCPDAPQSPWTRVVRALRRVLPR